MVMMCQHYIQQLWGYNMGYDYKGFEIQYHNIDNQTRDYFVIDDDGDCIHYTGNEQSCMDAIDNKKFNMAKHYEDKSWQH